MIDPLRRGRGGRADRRGLGKRGGQRRHGRWVERGRRGRRQGRAAGGHRDRLDRHADVVRRVAHLHAHHRRRRVVDVGASRRAGGDRHRCPRPVGRRRILQPERVRLRILLGDFPAYANVLALPLRRQFHIRPNRVHQDALADGGCIDVRRVRMSFLVDDDHREPVGAVLADGVVEMVLVGLGLSGLVPGLALVVGNPELKLADLRALLGVEADGDLERLLVHGLDIRRPGGGRQNQARPGHRSEGHWRILPSRRHSGFPPTLPPKTIVRRKPAVWVGSVAEAHWLEKNRDAPEKV